jgi:glucose 1-dehydrogenase
MKRCEGKIALVTGAARGIGHGVALCLAAEGADIVVNDRADQAEAQATLEAITKMGRRALFWQADVTDRAAVANMVKGAVEHFGRLDILVANAVSSVREPVLEARWEGVLETITVIQFGVFHTCQFAAQQMVKQELNGRSRGKIIIIGSIVQEFAIANLAAYSMSKAAINDFGEVLARELAPHRVNVNVINPGWIDTPGERKFFTEEEIQAGGKKVPWGRIGQPEDIGNAAAFLASDEADYITGAALRVDGGYMVGLGLAARGIPGGQD